MRWQALLHLKRNQPKELIPPLWVFAETPGRFVEFCYSLIKTCTLLKKIQQKFEKDFKDLKSKLVQGFIYLYRR